MCDHVIVTLISTHWVLVTIPTPQPTQRMSTLQGRRQRMSSRLVVVRVQSKKPEHENLLQNLFGKNYVMENKVLLFTQMSGLRQLR
jgi:hypothetical protein